ncbi:hypothetical protein ACL2XG_17715 [Sodalis sp. RH24]
MQGDKTLQTANEYLQLENADKRSDALGEMTGAIVQESTGNAIQKSDSKQ